MQKKNLELQLGVQTFQEAIFVLQINDNHCAIYLPVAPIAPVEPLANEIQDNACRNVCCDGDDKQCSHKIHLLSEVRG